MKPYPELSVVAFQIRPSLLYRDLPIFDVYFFIYAIQLKKIYHAYKCQAQFCPFRYESTITAQFFGHTHYDEFELFYDMKELGRPISVAYVGPSVTPYFDLNPGYRIYYVDGDHKQTTRVSQFV